MWLITTELQTQVKLNHVGICRLHIIWKD